MYQSWIESPWEGWGVLPTIKKKKKTWHYNSTIQAVPNGSVHIRIDIDIISSNDILEIYQGTPCIILGSL